MYHYDKAFLFYQSFYEVILKFPKKDRAKVARCIMNYGMYDSLEGVSDKCKIILRPIFISIDVQRRRFNNSNRIDNVLEVIRRRMNHLDKEGKEKYLEELENAINELNKLKYKVKQHDILDIEREIVTITNPKEKSSAIFKVFNIDQMVIDELGNIIDDIIILPDGRRVFDREELNNIQIGWNRKQKYSSPKMEEHKNIENNKYIRR